ncbi:heavy metal transporting ATPase [Tetragenococcus muriaticus PMC-11-5]|uniref:Heavy metal transporting ATPase n=1 Tax=Tetragenococcus muriaticus PMC-11-5 TaxID=1302649 RepID=A0A091CDF0_9ENTE|nr:heavy metal transporting ATPase [Tetragenococcus muriaticus PMC-11-5]
MLKDTYNIEGMTCASCVQAVEKSVGKLNGVDDVSVNLATEKMDVSYDSTVLAGSDIEGAVEDAGYKALKNIASQTFEIEGMTCASCVQAIEKSVGKVDGIQEVSVNLATEKMDVSYDEDAVTTGNIIKAVQDAGYQATVESSSPTDATEDNDKKQKQMKNLWIRFIWSAIFTLPLLYIAMGPMLPFGGLPLPEFLDPMEHTITFAATQLALTLPVIYLGRSFYTVGFKSLFKGHPNMDSLIAIGTTAALLQGIVMTALLAMGRVQVDSGHPDLYFESAAVILTLITLGKYLEAVSKGKTSDAIKKAHGTSAKNSSCCSE